MMAIVGLYILIHRQKPITIYLIFNILDKMNLDLLSFQYYKGMSKKVPIVLKVIDLEDKSKYPPIHSHLPQPPFNLLVCGSVKQGKTNLLVNLLRNEDTMYGEKYWDQVKIFSNSIHNDPKGKYLKDAFEVYDGYKDSYIDKFIDEQKSHEREDMQTALLVFDDIINKDFKRNSSLAFLSSRFRHIETSIAILTQSFRAISNIIRSNITNVIIFKQQSAKELAKIQEEYEEFAGDRFMDYYTYAINESPYSFLVIDAQTNPATFLLRFEKVIGRGDKSEIPQQPMEKTEPFKAENNE